MADSMRRLLLAVLLTLPPVLAGCAGFGERGGLTDAARHPEVDAAVYADLIQRMLARGQFYAALAHIEQTRLEGGERPRLTLYEAQALYGLGELERARAAYAQLLRGPLAPEAQHGLGLALADDDPGQALAWFAAAVRGRPTDIGMRNDYGYALMRAGRYREARMQLATAVELAPDDARARNNLLLLLMVLGDETAARRMAAETGLEPGVLVGMRAEAMRLRAASVRAP